MNQRVYLRGGPLDGRFELGTLEQDVNLLFEHPEAAVYGPTGETRMTTSGPVPVFEYIGGARHPSRTTE